MAVPCLFGSVELSPLGLEFCNILYIFLCCVAMTVFCMSVCWVLIQLARGPRSMFTSLLIISLFSLVFCNPGGAGFSVIFFIGLNYSLKVSVGLMLLS